MLIAAGICGVLALISAGLGFTGVLKGVAGAAKAFFFGFLAISAVLAAVGFYATQKISN